MSELSSEKQTNQVEDQILEEIEQLKKENEELERENEKLRREIEIFKKYYEPGRKGVHKAILSGDTETLKEAHKIGCPFDTRTIEYAAYVGHIHNIEFLSRFCSKFTSEMMQNAIQGGHFESVKYLMEKNCELSSSCIHDAIDYGKYDILVYLDLNGCPWPKSLWLSSMNSSENRDKCLEYVRQTGKVNMDKFKINEK